MKLNIFKKKEVKKEFKPNTLSKVLNVLPFIPLALLLLSLLFNGNKSNDVEQLQENINEVTVVDGDNISDDDAINEPVLFHATSFIDKDGVKTESIPYGSVVVAAGSGKAILMINKKAVIFNYVSYNNGITGYRSKDGEVLTMSSDISGQRIVGLRVDGETYLMIGSQITESQFNNILK